MGYEYVAISELSSLDNNITPNDLLLISRVDNSTNESITTSYTANIYKLINDISGWVYEKVNEPLSRKYSDFTETILDHFSTQKQEVDANFEDLSIHVLSDYEQLSTRIKNTCDTMDSLCVTLSTEISTFIANAKISVYNQMEWITNNYKNLCADMLGMEARLKAWADEKFVTLSGNDVISGNKTFTKDINGCALSARWI